MNKDPKWNKAQSLGLSPAFAVDTGVSTGNVNKYCFVLDQPVDSLRFATGGRANPSSTTTGICGTHTMKVTFPDGTVGTAGPNADNTLQYPSGVFPAGEYQIDFEQVTPCPGASDSLFLFHVKYGLPLAEQCAPPVPGGPTPSPSPSPGPSTPSAPVTGSLFGKDCNPLVLNNVYARAEAFVARDLAYSRQTIRHPDSSILVSCFPQYAKVVSKRSGDVFSGNFRDPLGDVIGDTMGALGINFVDSYLFDIPAFAAAVPLLRQFLGKDVLIGGDPDPGSFCQVPDLLWAQATTNGTIRDKLRYISFRELLNKEYAGLGDIAQENLDEDELIMFAVPQTEADLDALKPQLAPVVDYYGAYSLEEVLYRAGIPVTP